jgi:Ni,Fe-hydrogenase III large subunit
MTAAGIIAAATTVPCHPWPRHLLSADEWRALAAALAETSSMELLALWADPTHVHALFHDTAAARFLPASVAVVEGGYTALSPQRPVAAWFERMIHDLWGHNAIGGTDARPWLDHGRWGQAAPLAVRPAALAVTPAAAAFLPLAAEDYHQIALGPVFGTIGEPAHFRLSAEGEALLRLETRLGYAHKGTLGLLRGKSPRAAARFAARISGDAAVAHAIAFARAAEAAAPTEPPPRALALRAVMAELERIANHFDDVATIAEAAGFGVLAAPAMVLREAVLNGADVAFGHRLMMDCVLPGGVAADLDAGGVAAIAGALAALDAGLPGLVRLTDGSSSLADRLSCGAVAPALVARCAAGGPVGRAAGRAFDVRRTPGYPPYDTLSFEVPTLPGGDAGARLRLRLAEIPQSLRLLRDLLAALPEGPVSQPLPLASGEGIGWAEGCRGDIWHWLRLDGGLISAAFVRDPGWLHFLLLEAAVAGGVVADFPLCAASFGCSVSGVDL